MSGLRFGSLDVNEKDYNSLADFFFRDTSIELRIPWGLINVADPSSKSIIWKEKEGIVKKTEGIRVIALSYKPDGDRLTATPTGRATNHTDCLPFVMHEDQVKLYSWQGWNTPIYHTYLKESYHQYRRILAELPELV
jgi:hypothetical protein